MRSRDCLYAVVISVLSLAYLIIIFKYIILIRANVPTTFILSYGYKSIFLGLDHLRAEAGLPALGLADTWTPALLVAFVLILAAAAALVNSSTRRIFCRLPTNVPGNCIRFWQLNLLRHIFVGHKFCLSACLSLALFASTARLVSSSIREE